MARILTPERQELKSLSELAQFLHSGSLWEDDAMRSESGLTFLGLLGLLAVVMVVSAVAIPPLVPILAPLIYP